MKQKPWSVEEREVKASEVVTIEDAPPCDKCELCKLQVEAYEGYETVRVVDDQGKYVTWTVTYENATKKACPHPLCRAVQEMGGRLRVLEDALLEQLRKADAARDQSVWTRLMTDCGFLQGSRYDRVRDRLFTGHVSFGPVTIFGHNAMHYAVQVRTKRGFLVMRPTTGEDGEWRWYAFSSPDGTPGRAAWGIGPGFAR